MPTRNHVKPGAILQGILQALLLTSTFKCTWLIPTSTTYFKYITPISIWSLTHDMQGEKNILSWFFI